MIPILLYLLKANIVICALYGFYFLFFSRDTFYGHIRWYLLTTIVSAMIFPLVDISAWLIRSRTAMEVSQRITDVNAVYQYLLAQSQTAESTIVQIIPVGFIIMWCWLAVALFMMIKRLFQFAGIVSLWRSYPRQKNSAIIAVNKKIQPFSFFSRIFLNPTLHTKDELAEIVTHEQVHCRQGHTVDNLLSEALVCLCWFNPIAWLLRRDLKQNLEYYTDRVTLQLGFDRKHYQYNLLRVAGNSFQIVNNFHLNNLKKRIIMMNKKESPRIMAAKYLLVIPALAAVLLTVGCLQTEELTVREVLAVVEPIAQQTDNIQARPIFIVDDKEMVNFNIESFQPDNIQTMTVLKDQTAMELYGEKGKNGAIVITTKNEINPASMQESVITAIGIRRNPLQEADKAEEALAATRSELQESVITTITVPRISREPDNSLKVTTIPRNEPQGMVVTAIGVPRNNQQSIQIRTISGSKGTATDKPLIIIDGKEDNEVNIKPDNIESMTVLKSQGHIEQYGEKGKNGVIVITTKK